MSIDADQILKFIKDKTVQLVFGGITIFIFSFAGGRLTAPKCDKSIVCHDIIADNAQLSSQLEASREECFEKTSGSLETLKLEFEAICAQRVSEALSDCSFSENIHCPICIARGVCFKND